MKSAIPGFEFFSISGTKKIGTTIFPHDKHIKPFNKFPAYDAQRFHNTQNFSLI
jgi:hypothetical protein